MIKAEFAEIFREVTLPLDDDSFKIVLLHKFNKDVKLILVLVNFFTLDQLITAKELNETVLIDDVLSLFL